MTIVVLWANPDREEIIAAADSLLTEAEDPLLETAPKLFSLPVKVFTGLHRPKKVLDRSIGFAYAGSSLASAATFPFRPQLAKVFFSSLVVFFHRWPTLQRWFSA
jgi:hypothetical protein